MRACRCIQIVARESVPLYPRVVPLGMVVGMACAAVSVLAVMVAQAGGMAGWVMVALAQEGGAVK